jgi:hypothetical protein
MRAASVSCGGVWCVVCGAVVPGSVCVVCRVSGLLGCLSSELPVACSVVVGAVYSLYHVVCSSM